MTVTNFGPSDVTNAVVTDPAPAGLTIGSWTCAVTTQGTGGVTTACGAPSGSGPLNTTATLRNGAVVTYTINAVLTATGGSVTNTATVTPPGGTSNPGTNCVAPAVYNAGACSASDTDAVSLFTYTVNKVPSQSSLEPNSPLTFTITVTNNGPSNASGSILKDPAIVGFTASDVTCTGSSNGASCPAGVNLGNLQGAGITLTSLPAGGQLTFSLTGTFTQSLGSVTNTATVCPAAGITQSLCKDGTTTVNVFIPVTSIPTLSEYALMALMLMLAAMGGLYVRRARCSPP